MLACVIGCASIAANVETHHDKKGHTTANQEMRTVRRMEFVHTHMYAVLAFESCLDATRIRNGPISDDDAVRAMEPMRILLAHAPIRLTIVKPHAS